MSSTQIISLNEGIVLAAKETRRRHAEAIAVLNKGSKPNGSAILYPSAKAAKQGEILLYGIASRSNPGQMSSIIEYYSARFKDFFACSDFLTTEGEAVATAKRDSQLLQSIHDYRSRFIEKKLRYFSLFNDLKRMRDEAVWRELAAQCAEVNEFFGSVDGLFDCFLENLDKSGLLKSMTEFSLSNVFLRPSSLSNDSGKQMTKRYNTSEICPITRIDSKVIIKSEIQPYNWLTDTCKKLSEVIDHKCPFSIGVNELEVISLSDKLFNISGQFEHTFPNNETPQARVLEIKEANRGLIIAQIEFCRRMAGLEQNDAVKVEATASTSSVETTNTELREINDRIKEMGTKVDTVIATNINLKTENEELRNLFRRGLFDFALKVKPDDFRDFIYIMAFGNRSRAADELGEVERRFYARVNGWKDRGREYRLMFEIVEARKREMRKDPIPLDIYLDENKNVDPETLKEILEKTRSGTLDQRDYLMILEEVFDGLKEMNKENWEKIQKELEDILKEEIPQ